MKQISKEEYEALNDVEKYQYWIDLWDTYKDHMADLAMVLTYSNNPLYKSLGNLFGDTECYIAGAVYPYNVSNIIFLIINVMDNIVI